MVAIQSHGGILDSSIHFPPSQYSDCRRNCMFPSPEFELDRSSRIYSLHVEWDHLAPRASTPSRATRRPRSPSAGEEEEEDGRGQEWAISSANLNLGPTESGSSDCVSSLAAQDLGLGTGVWLLGGAFMKNMYTVFDFDQGAVGFAELS
ncbi:hypothetical protein B0H11DRAFT_2385824 [Mycena galericulata]|nr:hypothetical protein B0H11DRAFT_2385824 [Mycena galericulata]